MSDKQATLDAIHYHESNLYDLREMAYAEGTLERPKETIKPYIWATWTMPPTQCRVFLQLGVQTIVISIWNPGNEDVTLASYITEWKEHSELCGITFHVTRILKAILDGSDGLVEL